MVENRADLMKRPEGGPTPFIYGCVRTAFLSFFVIIARIPVRLHYFFLLHLFRYLSYCNLLFSLILNTEKSSNMKSTIFAAAAFAVGASAAPYKNKLVSFADICRAPADIFQSLIAVRAAPAITDGDILNYALTLGTSVLRVARECCF